MADENATDERNSSESFDLTEEQYELPGEWSWSSDSVTSPENGQNVRISFGYHAGKTGGWLGEIDNFERDGTEIWQIHTREIIPSADNRVENIPSCAADANKNCTSLKEALRNTAVHIAEHYSDTIEADSFDDYVDNE